MKTIRWLLVLPVAIFAWVACDTFISGLILLIFPPPLGNWLIVFLSYFLAVISGGYTAPTQKALAAGIVGILFVLLRSLMTISILLGNSQFTEDTPTEFIIGTISAFLGCGVAYIQILFTSGKRELFNKMSILVDLVKVGLYKRLKAGFSKKYEDEFAGLLAGAVVNVLFSGQPTDEEGHKFKIENIDIIFEEISKLRDDQEVRRIVTDAIRVDCTVKHYENLNLESDQLEKLSLDPILKLDELGILIPGGNEPKPDTFEAKVGEFLLSTESMLNK